MGLDPLSLSQDSLQTRVDELDRMGDRREIGVHTLETIIDDHLRVFQHIAAVLSETLIQTGSAVVK